MVIFDSTILISLLSEKTRPDDRARLDNLIAELSKAKTPIGIPTPVLAEVLVKTDEATTEVLDSFQRKEVVRVLPFDFRAAHEHAILTRGALRSGNKRGPGAADYVKVKFDRQIIAIARTNGASTIYTDDDNLIRHAKFVGLSTVRLADLPIPDAAMQGRLDLNEGGPED